MQAKDLPDVEVLRVIEECRDNKKRWTHRWDVELRFPKAHERVVRAKMKALIRRKLVTGCACGCRGDFEMTRKGYEFLAQALHG